MAYNQLAIYNSALQLIGERRLNSLSDDVETRYELDSIWSDNPQSYGGELVKPLFAVKVIKLDTPTTSNQHDFNYVHSLPSDYVDIVSLHIDGKLEQPVERFVRDGQTLLTDVSVTYLRYVSDTLLNDLNNWSQSFARVVIAHMAFELAERINPDVIEKINTILESRLQIAISSNETDEPISRPFDSSTDDAKLKVFNNALLIAGLSRIKSLNDERNELYDLNTVWALQPHRYCAEIVKPRFAATTLKLDNSTNSDSHGFDNVFDLPSDFVEMVGLYSDDRLDQPVESYIRDGDTLSSDYDTVYLRYINSTSLDDLTQWTTTFTRVVSAYLAKHLTDGERLKIVEAEFNNSASIAIDSESVDEPVKRSKAPTAVLTDEMLAIYNDALLILGQEHIVNTMDDSERRSILDVCLNSGLVGAILEDVGWHWATTSMRITCDPSIEPDWGYRFAHHLPTDMHRFDGVWYDEYMQTPVKYYTDEKGILLCDVDTIYIQYVSSDWMVSPELWKPSFKRYVAAKMAYDTMNMFKTADVNTVTMIHEQRERDIKSIDAQQSPPHILTRGSWTRTRTVSGDGRGRP